MTTVEDFGRANYVSLTTYRRDGRPVPTPVWHAVSGGELYIVSEARAGKVKRIRRDGRVVVAVCDRRGRIAPGATTAGGTARLLDGDATTTARALIARKYTLSRIGNALARLLRIRRPDMVGIAVSF
jgi:PPOX class probable F420-dependent enzyme